MISSQTAYWHPSGRWTLTRPERWNEPPLEWILTGDEVRQWGAAMLENEWRRNDRAGR